MAKKTKPEIIKISISTEQPAYNLDWAQSNALEYRPQSLCPGQGGVLGFLNEVENFARVVLNDYGDYEEAKKTSKGVAFPFGADPAAYQIRRSYPGEMIPADLDTAVELLSHVLEARRCLADSDSAGAFYHGQAIQRYLQAPETVGIRNRIRGSIPKTEKEEKGIAREIFLEYRQREEKITWKHLAKELGIKGITIPDGTLQEWLTEFRKNSD